MFTVLGNSRNSNLYLIAALAAIMVVSLTFAVVPAISAPQPILAPVAGGVDTTSDYYQRHPELSMSSSSAVDVAGDFYLRHPGWASDIQSVTIPVTGATEASDYFQRHAELVLPVKINVDTTDYFTRHPELLLPAETTDLSDYFLRH